MSTNLLCIFYFKYFPIFSVHSTILLYSIYSTILFCTFYYYTFKIFQYKLYILPFYSVLLIEYMHVPIWRISMGVHLCLSSSIDLLVVVSAAIILKKYQDLECTQILDMPGVGCIFTMIPYFKKFLSMYQVRVFSIISF